MKFPFTKDYETDEDFGFPGKVSMSETPSGIYTVLNDFDGQESTVTRNMTPEDAKTLIECIEDSDGELWHEEQGKELLKKHPQFQFLVP